MYKGLSSPSPVSVPGYGEISSRLLDLEDSLNGFGIRTTLKPNQRRSVAAMFQRELHELDVPDPLYIRLTAMNQSQYFLEPEKKDFVLDRPMMHPCRGGILCEDSGMNWSFTFCNSSPHPNYQDKKTLTIVTLIVATVDQISSPADSTTVMTPLSFRHFKSDYFASSKLLHRGKKSRTEILESLR